MDNSKTEAKANNTKDKTDNDKKNIKTKVKLIMV